MSKILSLELSDVKRIKAVALEPKDNGLTIIGGRNGQGKTSVLDAIAWTLGGDKFKPSNPQRDGSVVPPAMKITLDNGITVERSGKNSALKVTDESGRKGGQALLNSFLTSFALDLPKFLECTPKEKANVLLQIIGVGDKLTEYDNEEAKLYNRRLEIGRIAEQKAKYAAEMPHHPDAPAEPVSVSELIRRQQDILARNGENQRKRANAKALMENAAALKAREVQLERELAEVREQLAVAQQDADIASKTAAELVDESTAELEESIRNAETINAKVADNANKARAQKEADEYKGEYDSLTDAIEDVRNSRRALLNGADMPLPELSVENGELTYNGQKWDCMSGSEQLKAAAAIVRRLNPECGFVLIDKLEQMDRQTLDEFGAWLEKEGLQAIATRVSTGDECSIIIEDGYSTTPAAESKTWQKGVF
jgi:predicted ATP-dependent endonuclease of OLD family